jgi:hypothetical protein
VTLPINLVGRLIDRSINAYSRIVVPRGILFSLRLNLSANHRAPPRSGKKEIPRGSFVALSPLGIGVAAID